MRTICVALLLLAGCGEKRPPAPTPEQNDQLNEAEAMLNEEAAGAPRRQPDGAALTSEYCLKTGDEPDSPFDNTKSCLMTACDEGDKASCDLAATYNGNLNQD